MDFQKQLFGLMKVHNNDTYWVYRGMSNLAVPLGMLGLGMGKAECSAAGRCSENVRFRNRKSITSHVLCPILSRCTH